VDPKERPGSASFSFTPLLLIVLFLAFVFAMFNGLSRSRQENIGLNQLAADIRAGKVAEITVYENRAVVTYNNGKRVVAYSVSQPEFFSQLTSLGVTPEDLDPERIKIEIVPPSPWGDVLGLVGNLLPLILIVGLFWVFLRQMQGSNNAALNFGKSRARLILHDRPSVTFDDVAGAEEAKEELKEVVEFLRDPQKFRRRPARPACLSSPSRARNSWRCSWVWAPAGCGTSSPRPASTRRALCSWTKSTPWAASGAPDWVAANQLLVEMDGFDTDTNIIVMAATNRPDILDPALLRPGRFDRRIVIDRPDLKGRLAILKVHTRGKPLAPDVDLEAIARATPGFVGADLENLVNEAAILAARRGKDKITQRELEEAIERVVAGPERKSRVMSEEERRIIAYHEAGHAVVMQALPEADPVHKISIIPRGMAGGYTMSFPEEDRMLVSRKKLFAELVSLLGGRAAEELVFDDITSGAASDLERVTQLARTMVTRFGMSENLAPMTFGKSEGLIFLGRDLHEMRDYSEAVAQRIDEEVQKLVRKAYDKAKAILTQYRDILDRVAQALLEKETLTREEFEAIFPPPHPKKPTPSFKQQPASA